jgi:hypothetical protein
MEDVVTEDHVEMTIWIGDAGSVKEHDVTG